MANTSGLLVAKFMDRRSQMVEELIMLAIGMRYQMLELVALDICKFKTSGEKLYGPGRT